MRGAHAVLSITSTTAESGKKCVASFILPIRVWNVLHLRLCVLCEREVIRIRISYHSEGLIRRDIQKGEFFIVLTIGNITFFFFLLFVSISRL